MCENKNEKVEVSNLNDESSTSFMRKFMIHLAFEMMKIVTMMKT